MGNITFVQPNGYKFTGMLKGDEFGHVLTTLDGCALIQDRDGYYSYAWFDSQGHRFSSGVHVGETASSDVLLCSRQIPWPEVSALAKEKRRMAPKEEESVLKRMLGDKTVKIRGKARTGGIKMMDEGDDDGSGDNDDGDDVGTMVKHGLVILAEFSDVPFTYTKSDFEAMLTQTGYSVNGATGSAVEYFNASFNGLCDFRFTVSSIVTLPNEMAYYGGNDASGSDQRPAEMIVDACGLADDEIDFSLFDDDGDGVVDNVFVFYAGGDEAAGFGDDCVWSHSWYIKSGAGLSLSLDGVDIDRYACTAELRNQTSGSDGEYMMTGIGTFCHEYTHTFGLMDLYDTDYDNPEGSMIAAGLWRRTSLMDAGNYNNNGNTPPYFNAVERDALELWEPETLEEGTYVLEPINENGRYLKMETDTEGEYFLFECRSNDGWDAYINNGNPAAGLLVYHIDKSTSTTIYSPTYGMDTTPAQRWSVYFNEVNANPDHQCADLVEADGRSDAVTSNMLSAADLAGLFFPAGRTDFTPDTEPAFKTWGSYSSDLGITDIHMDGDNVVFTVISSSDIAVPYAVNTDAVLFQDAAIIDWESNYVSSRVAYITIGDETEAHEITPYSSGHYAYVADHLSPSSQYRAKIWYENYDGSPGETVTYSFTTKGISSNNAFPYIYFTTAALEDGSFYTGTKIPLRVYNATNAADVSWMLGSTSIVVGNDGYYELTSTGTLKATITYEDGTKEVITRRFLLTTPPAEEETE
ncbi:MAG: M6 family metalloprotease domain-containing protein [Bacteroidales bacterium]|nr:M6 family metalloprotease domain-containing protein [Bacteroidales bacterium]